MSWRRVFAGFFVGVLLVQAAWVAAMPAFRGPDEFDHVFRAEGVAHGSFGPGESVSQYLARGTLVPARQSVIDAASKVCASYKYTRYYNCHARGSQDGDWGQVGSGAGRYNPAYYVAVGNVARFVEGVTVDYVIRAVTAGICALMLAWAATLWVGLGRSRWRTLAFMTALTPVLLFSTAVAAPNGVSYAAGVLLWVAGLVVLSGDIDRKPDQAAVAATVGAIVMCNTHTTGPLWLALVAASWLVLRPGAVKRVLADRRYWPLLGVVAAGAIASAAWTLRSGANLPDPSGSITSNPELGKLAVNEVAWLLQTIAAFPLRNEFAPPVVYVLWLVPFVLLMAHAIRRRGGTMAAIAWIIFAVIATQTVLTFVGFKTDGYAWQGRYGLPLVVGLALVPGLTEVSRRPLSRPLCDSAIAAMVIATGVSVWHVGHNERLFFQRPWTDYVTAGPIAAGLLASFGTVLMAWALMGSGQLRKARLADISRTPTAEDAQSEAIPR